MLKAMLRLSLTLLLLLAPLSYGNGQGGSAPSTYKTRLSKEVSAETSFKPSDVIVNFFLLPLAYAFALPHGGFTRFPYETADGYGMGDREVAANLRSGRQWVQDGRQAQHEHLRVRGGNRLGWDIGLASYDPRTLTLSERASLYSLHVTMNYLQTRTMFVELGLGFASYQEPRARTGGSIELGIETFPRKPYHLGFRYQGARMQSRGFHDLSVSAGATWRWFGLSAGYRAFLNPIHNLYGPELALNIWF